MIIEISGQEKKIEAFIDLMRPFGIIELVRTGRIAMVRGNVPPPTRRGGRSPTEAADLATNPSAARWRSTAPSCPSDHSI